MAEIRKKDLVAMTENPKTVGSLWVPCRFHLQSPAEAAAETWTHGRVYRAHTMGAL